MILQGLLDDAAGCNHPGPAVAAHLAHRKQPYARLVGALVIAADDLETLRKATAELPPGSLPLALTVALPDLVDALVITASIPAVHLVAAEVSLPDRTSVLEVVPVLDEALGEGSGVEVYVEVPHDDRCGPLVWELCSTGYQAKIRTDGCPVSTLAESLLAMIATGMPFKASGLRRAVCASDPETGLTQHGLLNLLVAVGHAQRGAGVRVLTAILRERDLGRVLAGVRGLGPEVRHTLRVVDTPSVTNLVGELADLGLISEHAPGGLWA